LSDTLKKAEIQMTKADEESKDANEKSMKKQQSRRQTKMKKAAIQMIGDFKS